MAVNDKKKYNFMEPVLQIIQKKFISLNENDMRVSNEILKTMLMMITQKMKKIDSLFKEMFITVFYGGSYYDGLKVGTPEEFDLDLLLRLPKNVTYKLQAATNLPGYVIVKILNKQPTLDAMDLKVKFKGFDKFINSNGYLENSKVRAWMEGVVTSAMNCFGCGPNYVLEIPQYGEFSVKICKSGPAFTLKASGTAEGKSVYLDIDLVPSIVFQKDDWPQDVGFIENPVPNKFRFLGPIKVTISNVLPRCINNISPTKLKLCTNIVCCEAALGFRENRANIFLSSLVVVTITLSSF